MKKWLVGLLAAGLCAASAWAVTDTLEAVDFAATSTTYKDFSDVTKGSGAVYAGNSAKTGAGGIQLRSKDNSGIVTTGSGGTAAKVTIDWADGNADGRTIDVYGKSDAYSSSADLYAASSQGTKIGSIVLGSTELAIEDEYAFIGLRSSSGALYLDSVSIEWGGSAALSVSFDQESPLKLDIGTPASVTAVATGGTAPYSYKWESETAALNGTEATLLIPVPGFAADGTYTTTVTVTDAAGIEVSKPFVFIVEESYDVVLIPAENGSIESSHEMAFAGQEVTLTATPAAGYKLVSMTVTGSDSGNVETFTKSPATFAMPAELVRVGATFEEVTGQAFTLISSVSDLEDGAEYVITDNTQAYAITAELSDTSTKRLVSTAVAPVDGVITTDEAAIIWKLVKDEDGNFALYNDSIEKYIAWSSGNSAKLQDEAFANTISYESDLFVVMATSTAELDKPRKLQFNSSSTVLQFAYYEGAQKNLCFFKASGSSDPKVTFSGETTVEVGQSFELQFTLKNYEGDYSWVVEGGAGSISDEGLFTYAPAEAGVTVVMVKALDGEGSVIAQSIDIQLTANEPAAKYTIAIAEGIENGTVTADKAEAEVDEIVTLTITPAAGYKLDSVSVNDGAVAVTGNTFVMPAANVTVSATFVEFEGSPLYFQFEAEDLPTGYAATEADVVNTGLTAEEVPTVHFTLQRSVRGNLDNDKKVDTTALRLAPLKDQDAFAFNTSAFDAPISQVSFQYAKYGTDGCTSFKVQVSSDGTAWTDLADLTANVTDALQTYVNEEVPENSTFIRFIATNTGTSNNRRLDIDEIQLWLGAATFSVSFDKEDGFTVEQGTASSITATAKNGSGDYSYVWSGALTGNGATVEIPATLAVGDYLATVTVTDNQAEIIPIEKGINFSVVAPAVKYNVQVAVGILHGHVEVDKETAEAGETVTLTAIPAEGYKLETFLVAGEPIPGNTFVMPANDVQVSARFAEVTGQTFTLITSLAGLEDGAEYVITDNSQGYAITAELSTSSTKRLVSTAVAPVDGVITTDEAAIIWKLVKDDDGNFALYNASIEKYIGWSSGNSAKFQDDPFANTISYEGDLFVVMATSTAELEKPRKLQFNSAANTLQFAYYEGAQKNLCFFKASGAPKPSISYEGETTVEAGQQVSLQFTLKNYDGDYAWAVDSREGGSIDASGLYTWTPAEAGDVTIKVKAMNGETEIASKEVALTVTAPEPPAMGIVCNLGTSVEATVGVPVAFEFTVQGEGLESVDDWYAEWRDGDEIVLDFGDENKSASFEWTPGAAGSFTIDVNALVQPNNQLLELAVAVTVSEGGDVLEITGFSSSKDGLSFEVPAGVSVEAATSLVDADWTAIDIAPVGGKVTIPFEGDGKFYRLAK